MVSSMGHEGVRSYGGRTGNKREWVKLGFLDGEQSLLSHSVSKLFGGGKGREGQTTDLRGQGRLSPEVKQGRLGCGEEGAISKRAS